MDGRKNNGGARKGAGRPTKADEQKTNNIFLSALKRIHGTTEDDETKILFTMELMQSERGKMFVAEHLFGKPKEIKDISLNNVPVVDMSLWK